ncbi:MAG: prepilin peptidase [Candidatus Bathyarchaeota archaeon]|nr:prepilin peptidase [Candidatus Bathyarchaeota archaeon]
MSMQVALDIARIAVSIAFLGYASWKDHQTREVRNLVWAYYAPIALALTTIEFLLYQPTSLMFLGLSIGVTIFFALILFYTGGFGGADSKALMCIAIALPFAPTALALPLLSQGNSPLSQVIYPLTIFTNSVLFAALSGLYLLLHNLVWHKRHGQKMFEGSLAKESVGKKILVLLTGYRVPIAKLKEKWHIYPLEDLESAEAEAVDRKLMIVPKDEGRDKIVERLSEAIDAKKIDSNIWATPGLPMLIFVFFGLLAALVFGDIIWVILQSILL